MTRTPRPLGTRQSEMLAWLDRRQSWHPTANGTVVGRYLADTMRVIDALCRRGLAEFADGAFRKVA